MKRKARIKKDGIFIESEKNIEFEESELQKVHYEQIINKIRKELDDIITNEIIN